MDSDSHQNKRDIEVKVLDIDVRNIEEKLLSLGARKVFDRVITRTLIFDHPILRLRNVGKVLRLRQVGNKVYLSIKAGLEHSPTSPFQKVQDSELEINDFMQGFQMFEGLGFVAFRYQEKLRTGFTAQGGIRIEIDEYPKIPAYLEIEGFNEKDVESFLEKIGYKLSDSVKISATEVLRHYGMKDVDVIRFPNSNISEGIFK